jgi:hypothetical protein
MNILHLLESEMTLARLHTSPIHAYPRRQIDVVGRESFSIARWALPSLVRRHESFG